MKRRLCFALDLINDEALISNYERRHEPGAVWPGVLHDLHRRGFEEVEIWRFKERLVMVADVATGFPVEGQTVVPAEVVRWEAEMDQYQRPIAGCSPKWAEMTRIFNLADHIGLAPPMKRRKLARSGLILSELGIGCAGIGNLYRAIDDATARATLDDAIGLGFGYIDTAPFYGFGLSERRVGDAVRGRSDIVLSTKVGRLLAPSRPAIDNECRYGFQSSMPFEPKFDYTYDGVMRSFEASRHRLGLGEIDILLVHDIGSQTHAGRAALYFDQLTAGGGFMALERLRASGEIKAFGLGVNETEVCVEAMAHVDLDLILLAGRYTLLEQTALDRLLPECSARGVSMVVGGPYNSGILATGVRRGGLLHYDYGNAPRWVVDRVVALETVCEEFEVPLAAAALQFPLAHPAVVSVIPGIDSPARVRETLDLYKVSISPDFWRALRAKGMLHGDAPTPELT